MFCREFFCHVLFVMRCLREIGQGFGYMQRARTRDIRLCVCVCTPILLDCHSSWVGRTKADVCVYDFTFMICFF